MATVLKLILELLEKMQLEIGDKKKIYINTCGFKF